MNRKGNKRDFQRLGKSSNLLYFTWLREFSRLKGSKGEKSRAISVHPPESALYSNRFTHWPIDGQNVVVGISPKSPSECKAIISSHLLPGNLWCGPQSKRPSQRLIEWIYHGEAVTWTRTSQHSLRNLRWTRRGALIRAVVLIRVGTNIVRQEGIRRQMDGGERETTKQEAGTEIYTYDEMMSSMNHNPHEC